MALPAEPAPPACLPDALLVSCEHGGRRVPPAYAAHFAAWPQLLDSHRGWDPGALTVGRRLAQALGAPLVSAVVTRLLVDLNRPEGNAELFSEVTRPLPRAEREALLRRYHRPHWQRVMAWVAEAVAARRRVLHIASHSFTPVLNGQVRRADIGLLYDPQRPGEARLAQLWLQALNQVQPGLVVRRNSPYAGKGAGLTRSLRGRFVDSAYVGLELEVNQRFVQQGGPAWPRLQQDLVVSLQVALAQMPPAPVADTDGLLTRQAPGAAG